MMKTVVKWVAGLVIVALLFAAIRAANHQALWNLPREVGTDPWFIATLLDAYCGFLIFWLWVAYRERDWFARITWLVVFLLTGNIGTASYLLWRLSRIGPSGTIEDLLVSRRRTSI